MGVVYEAVDRERGTRVALKTLRGASDEQLGWLKREFRNVQHLYHPNLVAPHELVREGEQWLLAMDYVDGVDLLTYVHAIERVRSERTISAIRDIESGPTLAAADPSEPRDAVAELRAPIVRREYGFDEARLRSVLRQVAEALSALHAAGMVHRDVKPANVLVTPEGRVVVLDFGLVTEARAEEAVLAGTPAYMAPEQVGGRVGPEADWYAVGVMLYEILTGTLPFEGELMQVLFAKQTTTPRRPSELAPGVPPDLDELCLALLQTEPASRPTGAEVLERLGASSPASAPAAATQSIAPPFVGRASELASLRESFALSREAGHCVIVEGESGIGKSRLVSQFLERLAHESPDALVLRGRCFERESIPYKAFDGLVDALAERLARLSHDAARALRPQWPEALAQVFPALRRVPAFASSHARAASLDPREARSRAFGALRELFARLGEQRPLVLVIDDGQWADRDSLALLAEVTRAPSSPRMLLLVTFRTGAPRDDGEPSAGVRSLAELVAAIGSTLVKVRVGALAPAEGRELAERLAGPGSAPDAARIETIAREAAGHPLFIDALARSASALTTAARKRFRLEEVLAAEAAELPEDARTIAEIVCVAHAPLRQRVVERAVGAAKDAFLPALRHLRVAKVILTSGARLDDLVEPYHDRVRAAFVATLAADRRSALHRRIAEARIAVGDDDPEALALHWREAGDLRETMRQCIRAGDRATHALAFDRAAIHYEEALAIAAKEGDTSAAERRTLLLRLADALANAGRGKRAADVLRDAARGAATADELELRRRAAEQLLRAGHFDEGVALIEQVLATVGVRLPKTPIGALLYFLFLRAVLFVRGLGFRRRDETQVPREALVRADVCWSAAFGLAMNDTIRGVALQARTLLAALRLGEPTRVARALSLECAYVGQLGSKGWSRCERLMARAREGVDACDDAHARGFQLGTAAAAHYLNGRYAEARDLAMRANAVLRSECVGVAWELDTTCFFEVYALANLGDLRELVSRASLYLREALDRGDLYASVNFRVGYANLRWLVSDEPDVARGHIEQAMREWTHRAFHVEHFYEMIARTNLELYVGAPRAALEAVTSRFEALRRSLIPLRVQSVRAYAWHLRARAALACAAEATASERDALLQSASRDARRMIGEGLAYTTALGRLIEAGVAHVRGDDARAIRVVEQAATGFAETRMALHRTIAEGTLTRLRGGRAEDASAWLRAQGVRRPERFFAIVAPGLPETDVSPSG